MNMKRTMAAIMTATLFATTAAFATETTTSQDTAEMIPATAPEVAVATSVTATYTVVSALEEGGTSITVKGMEEDAQEIVLNIAEQTLVIDSQNAIASNVADIAVGDVISVNHSMAMTMSIPAQTAAYAIVTNLSETEAPAKLHTVESVTENEDGSITVVTDNGDLFMYITGDTAISPYRTRNIVAMGDITEGTTFFAWYDAVTMSIPAQTTASKIVIVPTEFEAGAESGFDMDVDMEMGIMPLEPSAYRYATAGTVTSVETETVDGVELVTSMNVKAYAEALGEFTVVVNNNTFVMDSTTGLPEVATFEVGDMVYVNHEYEITPQDPIDIVATAVMKNVSETSAPAQMWTVESIERNEDGSVKVLTDNKGMYISIPADAETSAFASRNIVKPSDINIGTTIVVWYDAVAESYPAQAYTEKVVIMPSVEDRTFAAIEGGDIAFAQGKIENGVAMVPMRAIAEKLGYTVSWDGETESVHITNETVDCTVKLGTNIYSATVNGEETEAIELGAASYEIDGTSYAPVELFNILGENLVLTGYVLHV